MSIEGKTDRLLERLEQLEGESDRLRQEIQQLREEVVASRSSSRVIEECETLRQAVLRYAIACAAVDVQVALMRARGESSKAGFDSLRKCTDEQTEASNALRALGRQLQTQDDL